MIGVHQSRHFCYQCDFSSRFNSRIESHKRIKHDILQKDTGVNCDICDNSAVSSDALNHHKISKHNWCMDCDKQFVNHNVLSEHISNVHVKICDFKCHNCDYTTILEENLKIHLAQNHIKEEIIKCDFCSFKHHNETDIQYHKLLKHNWCKYLSLIHI